MKTFTIIFGVVFCLLFCSICVGRIINVPADSMTIQRGIKGAINGDTVLVAPGHYHENIGFWGKRIMIASHFIFDSTKTTIDSTIIHGDMPSHLDTASVVRFISGEDTNSIICGLTLRDGTGTKIQTPGYNMERGGGIVCVNSSPTILNNVIVDNVAYNGGGIFCWGTRCIIRNNVIKRNQAPYYTSQIGDAGGIYITHATGVVIEGNVIDSNYACIYGGGILITFESESTKVWNNTFVRNWVNSTSSGGGAGLCIYSGIKANVKNNIVARNRNSAGIWCSASQVIISYNDVSDNPDGNFQGGPSGLGVITDTNACGDSCDSFYNISLDPLFCNPGNENYYLQTISPCLGCGENVNNIGALGWGCPVGDANGDGIIDLGDVVYLITYLYKNGPAPNPLLSGDANCSGEVELGDVVYLITYLYKGGPPPPC